MTQQPTSSLGFSRRIFIGITAALATMRASSLKAQEAREDAREMSAGSLARSDVSLVINGQKDPADLKARTHQPRTLVSEAASDGVANLT
jgi:hypothetical protein